MGFDTVGNDAELYTIKATGGAAFKVTANKTDDFSPSYSSDGKKIAFSHRGVLATDLEIWTINATGGGAGKVNITNNNTDDRYPDYSPNGKKIAFTGFDGTDEEIYTINVGGGTAFKVTNNDTPDSQPSWGSLP
jgi:Tol biopolymer transport system component